MKRLATAPRAPASRRVDVDAIEAQVDAAVKILRDRVQPADDTPEDAALATVENFAAIALAVFRTTNPSKLRSKAVNIEIRGRMDGLPECNAELLRGAS